MKKKTRLRIFILFFFIVCLIFMSFFNNTTLDTTYYKISSEKINENLSGLKIAHISDFHDSDIGYKIIKKLKEEKPDVVFLTGDMVDCHRYDLEKTMEVIRELVQIAPCYYVTGNHEETLKRDFINENTNGEETFYDEFIKNLDSVGVNVLKNECVYFHYNGEKIKIAGISDLLSQDIVGFSEKKKYINNLLDELLSKQNADYTILLAHRPELWEAYAEHDIDLTFSGHAHGGQFRFFGKGTYAPGQGWFPKYTSGIIKSDKNENFNMIISRGIGNSSFPIRFNNNPELIIVTLMS